MNKLKVILVGTALVLMAFTPGTALAYTSGSFEIGTTNIYRGLDLTRGVGVSGGLRHEHISGMHGAFTTRNLGEGNRTELSAGFATRSLNWGYDIGVTQYFFSESSIFVDESLNYMEFYGIFSAGPINLSARYADDYLSSSDSAWYLKMDYTWRGRTGVGLNLFVGHSRGSYFSNASDEPDGGRLYAGQEGARVTGSYNDYGMFITRSMRDFDWYMGFVSTDRGDVDAEGTSDRLRWILRLERSFDFF